MSPQALDQSKREPLKEANNWSSKLFMSSNVLQFLSLHKHHIKHRGAKFQILDKCFPSHVWCSPLYHMVVNICELFMKWHVSSSSISMVILLPNYFLFLLNMWTWLNWSFSTVPDLPLLVSLLMHIRFNWCLQEVRLILIL